MSSIQTHKKRLYEDIWRTTFGDSDDFIALYSRAVFDPRRTHMLTAYDQSRALSHVQYIPYRMRYGERIWRAGYICGVATQSDQRGKGLAQHLMRATHQQMWRDGCLCALLIPAEEWLYTFYRHMGYGTLCGKRMTPSLEGVVTPCMLSEAWSRFQHWQCLIAQFHPTVTHSPLQWRTFLESLTLEGGGVGISEGSSYYYYKDPRGTIQTALVIPPKSMPADSYIDKITPFAMLRPVHIPLLLNQMVKLLKVEVLKPYALYDDGRCISFDLLDEHIPTNSGRYRLDYHRGKICFAPRLASYLCHPITPDQILEALPALQRMLIYAMME